MLCGQDWSSFAELVYYGWNVIRDAWLNESEICYSASYAAASFSLVPSNLGVLFSAFTNRLENCGASLKRSPKLCLPPSRVYTVLNSSSNSVSFSSTNSTVSPSFLHSVDRRRWRWVSGLQIRPISTRRRNEVSLFMVLLRPFPHCGQA